MSPQPLRVLIVEDSPADRELYRRRLGSDPETSYTFLETDTGQEGLRRWNEEKPDCVLLDYQLPDSDGLEVLEQMAQAAGGSPLAVVMLTGQGDETVAVRAMKAGAQDYIVKGVITAEGLQRAVRNTVAKVALLRGLEEQRADLEQFAYFVSHDLQAPLRSVKSFTRLLATRYQGKLGADADEFLGFITGSVEQMQRLISDVLAYSRAGRTVELGRTDCEAVFRSSLAGLRAAIEESQAEVTHDPLPPVVGHPTLVGQLLQNLVGNAIKFRGVEAPRIHVSASRQGALWLFSVRDNGIGIHPDDAGRVFRLFERLDGADKVDGTGIGLAISKKIVERHGGRIWVESAPGSGSTFYFTLPAEEAAASEALAKL